MFQLVGSSRAVTTLPIGKLVLDPIKFNVTSGLNGLQGLKDDTVVVAVDVLGGEQSHMNLGLTRECWTP